MSNGAFQEPKYGTVFKPETGKLYVFEPKSIRVLASWPRVMAWKKTPGRPSWAHFRPKISIPTNIEAKIQKLQVPHIEPDGQAVFNFLNPPFVDRHELGWLQWYDTIPQDIRNLIAPFPGNDRQWHLLSLCTRIGGPAIDLILSNPALAYALASGWVFHPVSQPMRSARALLKQGKNQRDILEWLGFPGTKSARKILRKTAQKAISIPALLYLRQSMNDSFMQKAAAHLPRLNAGAIRFITDPALLPLVAPAFLEEIAFNRKEDSRPKSAYLLRDSVAMFELLFPQRQFPRPTRHLQTLVDTHDALIHDVNRLYRLEKDFVFPHPPLEGNDFIEPITTARGLIEEGRQQHNCVASFVKRIAVSRQVYVYRVHWPERCTLSITRRAGRWALSVLKLSGNQLPSKQTFEIVRFWLMQRQQDDPSRLRENHGGLEFVPF